MTTRLLLSGLRDLRSLIVAPEGDLVDQLSLQLIRIGCHVRHAWPTKALDGDGEVDLIFTGQLNEHQHNTVCDFVNSFDGTLTVIAIVEYESPTILAKIIELGAHGVMTVPFDANKVLPTIVTARSNSLQLSNLLEENRKFRERLNASSIINRAKVLLMAEKDMSETQAHKYMSELAMRSRRKISEVAKEIAALSP